MGIELATKYDVRNKILVECSLYEKYFNLFQKIPVIEKSDYIDLSVKTSPTVTKKSTQAIFMSTDILFEAYPSIAGTDTEPTLFHHTFEEKMLLGKVD